MSKKSSKGIPRGRSSSNESRDSGKGRQCTHISMQDLLNPSDSLVRRPSNYQRRKFDSTEDESDIERVSVSGKRGGQFDVSNLSKEQKRQLREQLKYLSDSDTDTGLQRARTGGKATSDHFEENKDPEPISAAEKKKITSEMPFLSLVQEAEIPDVLIIVRNTNFTIEERLEYLEEYFTKKGLKECELYLRNERRDFLKYAPTEADKRLAKKAMEQKKNHSHLKMIIADWDANAQTALQHWLEKENPSLAASYATNESSKAGKNVKEDGKPNNKNPTKKNHKSTTKEYVNKLKDKIPGLSSKHKEAKGPNYERIKDIPFSKELFDRCPKIMNIVLMGGTGIGKSTFVNNLVNLFSFSDLDDAIEEDFHVLIPASFTHVSADLKQHPIFMKANVKVEKTGDLEVENEHFGTGQSATQAPRSYLFSWGPESNRKYIRLIDTPGVGDIRGVKADNENFAKILDFIAGFKEIHAFCILMKANEARSTLIFRYCQNELFARLHKSATKNIFFCFTNSRGHDFSPGDTYQTLSEELKKLTHPIDLKGRYFCFDSESFRYLCCRRNGIEFKEDVVKHYQDSFDTSKKQVFRMFEAITNVEPHMVGNTLDVNNVRRLIMALLRPIADNTKVVLANERLMNEQVRALKAAEKRGEDVRRNMNIKVSVLATEPLDYPRTVCTSDSCTERKLINDIEQIHYKTICHAECYLIGIQTDIINNTALQRCYALSGHIDDCSKCHCPWNRHMHITYTIVTKTKDAIDQRKQDELNNIKDREEYCAQLIATYQQKIVDLGREGEKILKFLADALAFLNEHSIVFVNDAFIAYLDHMIELERVKVQHGGDGTLLDELTDYRDQYKELVDQNARRPNYKVKSTKEMYDMIEELKGMAQNGDIFKEVQDLEMLQLKDQPDGDANTVNLNRAWMGWVFDKMGNLFK